MKSRPIPIFSKLLQLALFAGPLTLTAVTVLESIQLGTDFLTRKKVESPRLQTELILAHILAVKRMQLYLQFEKLLAEEEITRLRDLLKRRGRREPLQHILGTICFCGIELKVNRQVLVPRPETELLAERAWQHVCQLESSEERDIRVLDFGTGSGCLAIAVASHSSRAAITAVDISPEALAVAQENANASGQDARVHFLNGNGFDPIPKEQRFDLIVSNPPYIAREEIETLEPEVRDFDPRCALDGGVDGLDFYHLLATEGPTWIKPGGRILLEFGDGQAPAIGKLFAEQNWIVEGVFDDYTRRPRIIMAKWS